MISYLDLLDDVIESGEAHSDRTGVCTRSVFGRQLRHNMRTGFPLLTTKKLAFRWIFEELRWFLSGSTDAKVLQDLGITIWDSWSSKEQCDRFGREEGDLGPIYGHQWRNFGLAKPGADGSRQTGFDQIANLMNEITHNPNSRRLIVTGWHPFQATRVALPPCHTMWQIKCHTDTNEMSLHLYQRSADIFLGVPYNIASYALLLTMLARVTNYFPRDLIISFGDLHLYNNHFVQAEEQLQRNVRDLPTVEIHEPFLPDNATPFQRLLNLTWENMELTNYDPHPSIKADVAI